ncbi:MAG: NUDIX domain-containing protein [Prolixibacteraceae bacterium]|nr:NUDIX domain-containing protein [Prolixibacteraceae bacterium]
MQKTHPLNVVKFCPKCGSPKFEASGERSMKCKTCGFHLYFNSSAAVAALITDNNKKLMLVTRGIEPDYGKLDLPGGFIDPGETAEDAVRRELWEELGLKTKSLSYISSAPNEYVFSDFTVFTIDFAFEVIAESLEGLNPMDDILEFKFYSEDEIDYREIPAPSIRKFVQDYFKR